MTSRPLIALALLLLALTGTALPARAADWAKALAQAQAALDAGTPADALRLASQARRATGASAPVTAAWCLEGRALSALARWRDAEARLERCLARLTAAGAPSAPTALAARQSLIAAALGRNDPVDAASRARSLLDVQRLPQIVWAIEPDQALLRHRQTGLPFAMTLGPLVRGRVTTAWVTGEDVSVSYGADGPPLAATLLLTRLPDRAAGMAEAIEASQQLFSQLWSEVATIERSAFAPASRPDLTGTRLHLTGRDGNGLPRQLLVQVLNTQGWQLKVTVSGPAGPQALVALEAVQSAVPWTALAPTRGA